MINYVEHYEKRDYIYPISRQKIYFKLRTNIENIKEIDFIYFEKIRQKPELMVVMNNFNVNGNSPYYFGNLKYEETIKYIDYFFRIITDEIVYYYSPDGLKTVKPLRSFRYSDTNYYDVFRVPHWAEGLTGYEIFPDRFNIGDQILVKHFDKWNETPTRTNYFGGNIKGITAKIDYLKRLNVGLIYLTPIFKAYSNHKYDTIDYFEIDPGFGTKEDLKELVRELHKEGIKIVLDGVFNHIGFDSPQFQDVIQKGKSSPYYDWFYIYGDTVDIEHMNYECVGYHKWMPKLKYETKEVREYILKVGEYWLKDFGIDGYRLDVSDEVDYTFWNEFRKLVKSLNKEALLIGETWKNGSDLLGANAFDSIMNYRLRDALLDFIQDKRIDLEEFKERIESIYFDYPKQTHKVLYNLLGSHDTERIFTLVDEEVSKAELLVSILFNLPGIPFIYYGDEVGMTGKNDPLSRKTMDWSKVDNEMNHFYMDKAKYRNSSEVIKYGDLRHIEIAEGIYSFVRRYKDEKVVFLANTTNEVKEFSFSVYGQTKDVTLLPYKSEIIHFNR